MVVSSGRSTALEHLAKDHHMDKATGELLPPKPSNSGQPMIEEYPE